MGNFALKRDLKQKQPIGRNTFIKICDKTTEFSLEGLKSLIEGPLTDRAVVFCRKLEECGKIYAELQSIISLEARAKIEVSLHGEVILLI